MGGLVALLVVLVLIVLILASCIKIVPQAQAYVVERLGAYQQTWSVGLHIKVPFIDKVAKRVVLFFLIMSWWYLLLIWLGLWLFIRWNKKRMAKYHEERARGNIPYMSPSRSYQAVRPVPSPHDQMAENAQNAQNVQNVQKGYPDALRPEESIQKEGESDTKTPETAADSEASADDTESTNESEKSEET